MGQQNPSPDDTLDGLSNYLKGFSTSKVVQDFLKPSTVSIYKSSIYNLYHGDIMR
jgi:hypothetical protein